MFTLAGVQEILSFLTDGALLCFLAVWRNLPELIGAVMGIAGALMLALKCRLSAWAWPIWLISNMAWIYYALAIHAYFLLSQQVVFTIINLYGAWHWLYKPNSTGAVQPLTPPANQAIS